MEVTQEETSQRDLLQAETTMILNQLPSVLRQNKSIFSDLPAFSDWITHTKLELYKTIGTLRSMSWKNPPEVVKKLTTNELLWVEDKIYKLVMSHRDCFKLLRFVINEIERNPLRREFLRDNNDIIIRLARVYQCVAVLTFSISRPDLVLHLLDVPQFMEQRLILGNICASVYSIFGDEHGLGICQPIAIIALHRQEKIPAKSVKILNLLQDYFKDSGYRTKEEEERAASDEEEADSDVEEEDETLEDPNEAADEIHKYGKKLLAGVRASVVAILLLNPNFVTSVFGLKYLKELAVLNDELLWLIHKSVSCVLNAYEDISEKVVEGIAKFYKDAWMKCNEKCSDSDDASRDPRNPKTIKFSIEAIMTRFATDALDKDITERIFGARLIVMLPIWFAPAQSKVAWNKLMFDTWYQPLMSSINSNPDAHTRENFCYFLSACFPLYDPTLKQSLKASALTKNASWKEQVELVLGFLMDKDAMVRLAASNCVKVILKTCAGEATVSKENVLLRKLLEKLAELSFDESSEVSKQAIKDLCLIVRVYNLHPLLKPIMKYLRTNMKNSNSIHLFYPYLKAVQEMQDQVEEEGKKAIIRFSDAIDICGLLTGLHHRSEAYVAKIAKISQRFAWMPLPESDEVFFDPSASEIVQKHARKQMHLLFSLMQFGFTSQTLNTLYGYYANNRRPDESDSAIKRSQASVKEEAVSQNYEEQESFQPKSIQKTYISDANVLHWCLWVDEQISFISQEIAKIRKDLSEKSDASLSLTYEDVEELIKIHCQKEKEANEAANIPAEECVNGPRDMADLVKLIMILTAVIFNSNIFSAEGDKDSPFRKSVRNLLIKVYSFAVSMIAWSETSVHEDLSIVIHNLVCILPKKLFSHPTTRLGDGMKTYSQPMNNRLLRATLDDQCLCSLMIRVWAKQKEWKDVLEYVEKVAEKNVDLIEAKLMIAIDERSSSMDPGADVSQMIRTWSEASLKENSYSRETIFVCIGAFYGLFNFIEDEQPFNKRLGLFKIVSNSWTNIYKLLIRRVYALALNENDSLEMELVLKVKFDEHIGKIMQLLFVVFGPKLCGAAPDNSDTEWMEHVAQGVFMVINEFFTDASSRFIDELMHMLRNIVVKDGKVLDALQVKHVVNALDNLDSTMNESLNDTLVAESSGSLGCSKTGKTRKLYSRNEDIEMEIDPKEIEQTTTMILEDSGDERFTQTDNISNLRNKRYIAAKVSIYRSFLEEVVQAISTLASFSITSELQAVVERFSLVFKSTYPNSVVMLYHPLNVFTGKAALHLADLSRRRGSDFSEGSVLFNFMKNLMEFQALFCLLCATEAGFKNNSEGREFIKFRDASLKDWLTYMVSLDVNFGKEFAAIMIEIIKYITDSSMLSSNAVNVSNEERSERVKQVSELVSVFEPSYMRFFYEACQKEMQSVGNVDIWEKIVDKIRVRINIAVVQNASC